MDTLRIAGVTRSVSVVSFAQDCDSLECQSGSFWHSESRIAEAGQFSSRTPGNQGLLSQIIRNSDIDTQKYQKFRRM